MLKYLIVVGALTVMVGVARADRCYYTNPPVWDDSIGAYRKGPPERVCLKPGEPNPSRLGNDVVKVETESACVPGKKCIFKVSRGDGCFIVKGKDWWVDKFAPPPHLTLGVVCSPITLECHAQGDNGTGTVKVVISKEAGWSRDADEFWTSSAAGFGTTVRISRHTGALTFKNLSGSIGSGTCIRVDNTETKF